MSNNFWRNSLNQKVRFTSYIQRFFLILIACLFMVILSYSIFDLYQEFIFDAAQMRNQHVDYKKNQIKRDVKNFIKTIEFERDNQESIAKKNIRDNLLQAHTIATQIYENNVNKEAVKAEIIEVLRNYRYADSIGYIFIFDTSGIELLFTDKPELEGQNLREMKDHNGKYIVKDMIDIASRNNEGYYEYSWSHPNMLEDDYKKISCIKMFKPFNWIIGTGLYQVDIETKIKKMVLKYTNEYRYDEEEYIFASDWEGLCLTAPAKNQNMYNAEDANGVKIVQEMISIAKDSCGFFEYMMPVSLPTKERKKMSFVQGIPDWKWYVGSGVYLDEIEVDIAVRKRVLYMQIIKQIIILTTFISMVVFAVLFFLKKVDRRLTNDFRSFYEFLGKLTFSQKKIDYNEISFFELESLAKTANKMLDDKLHIEEDLLDEKERLSITLDSISNGIITTNVDGTIDSCNIVAEKLLGIVRDDIINTSFDTMCNDYINFSNEYFSVEDVLNNKQSYTHEITIHSKLSEVYNVVLFSSPLLSASKEFVGVVFVLRDINNEKEHKLL